MQATSTSSILVVSVNDRPSRSGAGRCVAATARARAPSPSRRLLVLLVSGQPRRALVPKAPALVLPEVPLQHVLARALFLAPADHRHAVQHVRRLGPDPLRQVPAIGLRERDAAADPVGRVGIAQVDGLDVSLEVLRAAKGLLACAVGARKTFSALGAGGRGRRRSSTG